EQYHLVALYHWSDLKGVEEGTVSVKHIFVLSRQVSHAVDEAQPGAVGPASGARRVPLVECLACTRSRPMTLAKVLIVDRERFGVLRKSQKSANDVYRSEVVCHFAPWRQIGVAGQHLVEGPIDGAIAWRKLKKSLWL